MNLDPVHLEMNLEVVQFLMEHGADKNMKSKTNNLNSIEMATNHCASSKVKKLLQETKQTYFHPVLKQNGKGRRDANGIILDDSKVKVGCCSMFYFCRGR